MSKVFISYRREDAAPWAGRICDRVSAAFGPANVFMDVEDIAPGTDFTDAIDSTVSGCDVLLAVIGPKWLDLLQARKETGTDFVEREILSALQRGITVIPVLVGGAEMPQASQLTPVLRALHRRHAVQIRDDSFDVDTASLISAVGAAGVSRKSSRGANRIVWLVVAAGIVIALAGSAFLLLKNQERSALNGTWLARMQRPGQRPYNIRLNLITAGRTITGNVEYPTGTGAIEEGRWNSDGSLSFYTRHTPQFETTQATIRFTGQHRGRELDLNTVTSDGTITKGVARKSQ
ncbi:MAG: toll/interleukin-1 receptor domain-containing protein [Bryobacteraceae bacterium]|nr:toll/interleukin-1 receptor domain-containing protein [Bryobacteraceae bacterium]